MNKNYWDEHREDKREYNKEYSQREVDCEVCGCRVRKCSWARHLGTRKHMLGGGGGGKVDDDVGEVVEKLMMMWGVVVEKLMMMWGVGEDDTKGRVTPHYYYYIYVYIYHISYIIYHISYTIYHISYIIEY